MIFTEKISEFKGIGKPEELKHGLLGRWSRRINREHRIVYGVGLQERNIEIVIISSLKGHY